MHADPPQDRLKDPSTKHVLEGRELIDYLVEKASSTTNAELLQREERRNRRSAAVLSVLGFIGLGAIVGAIKMFVQQEVLQEVAAAEERIADQVRESVHQELVQQQHEFENSINTAVAEKVSQKVGTVRRELYNYKVYQELIAQSELVTKEVAEGKIPRESLRLAYDAIDRLAEVEEITELPRFLEAVNAVVDVLVRTDRDGEIDQLQSKLSHVLVKHLKMTLDLTDHYGQVIVSSPYPVEKLEMEYGALKRYAQASRELRYPEKALMWELFVAYKASGYEPTQTTRTMVEMVQDLNQTDLNNFCYQVVRNSDPYHWMQRPDHEGREMARLVAGLLDDHPKLAQIITTQASEPDLATRISKLTARRLARLEAAGLLPPQEPPVAEPAAAPPQPPVETALTPGAGNRLR